jgi:hypothetical protein
MPHEINEMLKTFSDMIFEVLTEVNTYTLFFPDVASCNLINVYQSFIVFCGLRLQRTRTLVRLKWRQQVLTKHC